MTKYRTRLYANYGHEFQDANGIFDVTAARRWGKSCRHYLHGWLPHQKSASVLDVACGGGRLLQLFVDQGYTDIRGVDLSPDQVEISRQVTPQVHLGDAIEYLKAHEKTFDLITGFDIIEHFHKDEVLTFLAASYSALRAGGRLVLQTPNADSVWGTQHRYNDFTHEVGFNPNSMSRLLRLTGFVKTESRECGPVKFGVSVTSTTRWALWQAIRCGLIAWNLVETGASGSGVFTRVFIASGMRPAE